ncbi:MAG: SpoIVB peptidase S55 domain-containing protein, partial [Romboutsia sp.]
MNIKNKIYSSKFSYFRNKFIIFSILLFSVYFFSNNLIYAQTDKDNNNDYLIPSGKVIQIDAELKHILVRNICEGSPFLVGDTILKVNDTSINSYSDFSKIV